MLKLSILRTVPPIVTVDTFCASRDIRVLFPNTTIFLRGFDHVEKANISKGYQNRKRKLGVTTYFSEIIELKFGKELPYILCILTLF